MSFCMHEKRHSIRQSNAHPSLPSILRINPNPNQPLLSFPTKQISFVQDPQNNFKFCLVVEKSQKKVTENNNWEILNQK
ncbi:hypothetical protein F8388_009087 [Cannabis sativa]|uniref:Uncharacterized protein n=1 Tax=Cannabis sativa TaxID=3483 RepID=A0A7J6GJF3_CANSA|nr:hypothetical protein F8388_009087 [Cannabis sativa]